MCQSTEPTYHIHISPVIQIGNHDNGAESELKETHEVLEFETDDDVIQTQSNGPAKVSTE